MTKDYLTSPFNDKYLHQIREIEEKITNSPAARMVAQHQKIMETWIPVASPAIDTNNLPIFNRMSSQIIKESPYFEIVKNDSFVSFVERSQSIFQKFQSPLASFYNSVTFCNPAFISLDSAFNDELIKQRYKTTRSQNYRKYPDANEPKNGTVEQKPNEIIDEMTIDLNSKVEKLDKGFFHGLITPFATKEEFGRYVSQEIISLLLNLIMTYAITLGVADAEKIYKIIFFSIKNRLKHF